MKNLAMFVLLVGIIPMLISCTTNVTSSATEESSATATSGGAGGTTGGTGDASGTGGAGMFNEVSGKDWILTEIRSAQNTIQIDRGKLQANNIGGFFTINFQEGNVSGVGAPNRFRGPYTTGSGNALSLGNVASTLMAAFIEAEELKEHEYYSYLGKVTRWNLRDGKLELYSSNPDGAETVLVFSPA